MSCVNNHPNRESPSRKELGLGSRISSVGRRRERVLLTPSPIPTPPHLQEQETGTEEKETRTKEEEIRMKEEQES